MVDKLSIKDKLNQVSDIKKRISKTIAKIKELEEVETELATVEASYKRPPFTKHSITIQAQTKKTREKISFYKSLKQEQYNDLLSAEIEVERFINNLPTARLQLIFEYRYIDICSWREIALKMHTTEDSIRMEHNRFLEKI